MVSTFSYPLLLFSLCVNSLLLISMETTILCHFRRDHVYVPPGWDTIAAPSQFLQSVPFKSVISDFSVSAALGAFICLINLLPSSLKLLNAILHPDFRPLVSSSQCHQISAIPEYLPPLPVTFYPEASQHLHPPPPSP